MVELDGALNQLRDAYEHAQSHADPDLIERYKKQYTDQGYSAEAAKYMVDNGHFTEFNPIQKAQDKFNTMRDGVLNLARDLMQRNDPTAVLNMLYRRGDTTSVDDDRALNRPGQAVKAVRKSTREVAHTHVADQAVRAKHAGKDLKKRDNKDAKFELMYAGMDSGTARHQAVKDRGDLAQAQQHAREARGRGDMIWDLADQLNNERENLLNDAENDLRLIDAELQRSPLTQELKPGELANMKNVLDDVDESLKKLSRYDPERSNLRTAFISISHRIKQREISTNVKNGRSIDAVFLPDGGIRINLNTPEETVLYDNGDQGIIHWDGAGNIIDVVRVKADGTPSDINKDTKIEQVPPHNSQRIDFPDAELAAWDRNRGPESTARAHAELKAFNTTLEMIELKAEAAYLHAHSQKPHIEQFIHDKHDALRHVDTFLKAEHAKGTPASDPRVQQAITDRSQINAALNKAQNDWANNEQTLRKMEKELSEVRKDLGPGRYWQGVLEIRMAPEASVVVKKKKILGILPVAKAVQADPAQIEPTADLLPDGSVVWKNHIAHPTGAPTTAPSRNGVWRWFFSGDRRRIA